MNRIILYSYVRSTTSIIMRLRWERKEEQRKKQKEKNEVIGIVIIKSAADVTNVKAKEIKLSVSGGYLKNAEEQQEEKVMNREKTH